MGQNKYDAVIRVAEGFNIDGTVASVTPFGSGHINDTYRIALAENKPQYLLQRINHLVFRDVKALMDNIALVISHLKSKQKRAAESTVLTIIPHRSGENYYQDSDGNFWRVFLLLENTRSYDVVETAQQAYEGGKAFGRFQLHLADLDAQLITAVLPDFHHLGSRLTKLAEAVRLDTMGREKEVLSELVFIKDREQRMSTILQLGESGELPLRITHNDTKFNNVLLNERDEAQCVIDLDTVMPGYVAYDFGDAIRTIINRVAEDEADLNKIALNIPLFSAYTAGYFRYASHFLTKIEIDSLIEGVLLLPYIQAIRFLTDYLEGDHYFKTQHEGHNLQRARVQLKLVSELEKKVPELRNIVEDVARQYQMA